MEDKSFFPLDDRYTDYLTDESGLKGEADSISFPETENEIVHIVQQMVAQHTPITIQGGKTGILGGSVPAGGHLMNLSRMKAVKNFSTDGGYFLTVEPGITLDELEAATDRLNPGVPLFWPPDPTEKTASLGGVVSSGSAGCTAGFYGPTADYVESLRVVDAEGRVHDSRRGEFENPMNRYLSREGILGVLTEVTLRLIEKPKEIWGIAFFFDTKPDACRFAEEIGNMIPPEGDAAVAAMEYLDRQTIDLIEEQKEHMSSVKDMPDVPAGKAAMVYLEIHGTSEGGIEGIVEVLINLAVGCHSDPDEAWAVSGQEIEKLRAFRHAAAESVNLKIQGFRRNNPGITKLGTDMTLPGISFGRLVRGYENDMAAYGLKGVIFGHIAGNHLHVNILPENPEQYRSGKDLIRNWAIECREADGRIITEHGVGKLKAGLFAEFGDRGILEELRRLKKELDPGALWNPGTVISFTG